MVAVPAPIAASRPRRRFWLGALAALTGLAVAGSAFESLRFRVGGMLVHPMNFLVLGLFVLAAPTRLRRLAPSLVLAIFAFLLATLVVTVSESGGTKILVKLTVSFLAFVAAACAVDEDRDFRLGVLGLAIAVAIISVRGLSTLEDVTALSGINPMEGIANKNAFSLYALPALLLSGHVLLREDLGRLERLILGATLIVTVVAIYSTSNRSGWLGVVVVLVLLAFRAVRRVRRFLIFGAVVGGVLYALLSFGNLEIISTGVERTQAGLRSDALRVTLVRAAFDAFLEHPFLGVSPQELPFELARRTGAGAMRAEVSSHNAFAFVLAGGGLLWSLSFLALGVALWRRPWGFSRLDADAKTSQLLLRSMLILWVVRGMFSLEIFYAPAFMFGLGLCVASCAASGVWARRPKRSVRPAPVLVDERFRRNA